MTAALRTGAAATALAVLAALPAMASTVVLSNDLGGDNFTNPTGTNTGQAVGSSGWYYNNVRSGGTMGIDDTYARDGNGSVFFETAPVGAPGTTNAKADIEFLPDAAANADGNYFPTAPLGAFSDLAEMSYEWYRDSASTANAVQHPALRVLLAVPTTEDSFAVGGLVFERAYNGGVVPTDEWQSDTVTATSGNVWNFGLGLGFAADITGSGTGYDQTIADWQAALSPDTLIIGFSAGVGSGWGYFKGAVDNIAWTIGDSTTHSNFEVAGAAAPIPLPAAGWLLLGALGALAALGRRRA